MNISSIVIKIKDINLTEQILQNLAQIEGCEVVASQDGKIVALVSVEKFDDELATFKQIERIDGVAGVAMIYSYQEDVDLDKQKLEASDKLSEILTNDELQARDIVYSGSINHRVR